WPTVRGCWHCWLPREPSETGQQYFESMLRMGRLPGTRLALRIALKQNHWFVQRLAVPVSGQQPAQRPGKTISRTTWSCAYLRDYSSIFSFVVDGVYVDPRPAVVCSLLEAAACS